MNTNKTIVRNGGDPFHDLAVHDIDYVCHLVGEYPSVVMGSGMSLTPELKECNVMDKAAVWLQFKSGVTCTIDLSRGSSYGYDQRIEVFGDKGMAQVRNQPLTSTVLSTKEGVTHDVFVPSFPERFNAAYNNELQHFLSILEGKSVPAVTKDEVTMATYIAEAAKRSAETNSAIRIVSEPTAGANLTYN